MLLAHLSDLHVQVPGDRAYGVVDTNPMVQKAIEHVAGRSPDVVVITGDLVHRVQLAEYQQLQSMLAQLTMPVFLLPGNHDSRSLIRQVFAGHTYLPAEGFLQYAVERYPLRLLMLDTNVPGQGYGELDSERLQWLDTQLAEQPHKPTFIFMHHPPFSTGIALMDGFGLRGGDDLAKVVERYDCVERVCCGHIHRPIQKLWAGTLAYTVPSPVHQISLELSAKAHSTTFTLEPPAYQLHVWSAGELVSHMQYINAYEGPYPFYR